MTTQTTFTALAAGLVVGVLVAHAIVASWGTIRLAGRIVLRAALAFAVLFLLAVGIGPLTGKYRTVTVLSGSMQPAMPPGSMAILIPVDPSSIQVGDVLTYEAPVSGHPVVTHRVIEVLEHGDHPVIRTKGDANVAPDQWTARISSAPAWRRVAVVPAAGTLVHSLRSPLVHQATVYVVPVLLLMIWLVGIWSRESEPKPVAGVGAS
ncbi:MAG: signal peptidase [Acidimicrobiaceae bacterium]